MSCFFDSLTQALTDAELKSVGIKRSTPALIDALKIRNIVTTGVHWQGKYLNNQEMIENSRHVREYDAKTYNRGYLTSSGDPFLILYAQIFNLEIDFEYCGHMIHIAHVRPVRTVKFKATRTHFSCSTRPCDPAKPNVLIRK